MGHEDFDSFLFNYVQHYKEQLVTSEVSGQHDKVRLQTVRIVCVQIGLNEKSGVSAVSRENGE